MTIIDNAVDDIASRFGLGAKSGQLVQEVVGLMTGTPGGIGGFIDKFRSAGLGNEVTSWLGRADGSALSGSAVEGVLGSNVLGGIASRMGLASGAVATAIGYLLPKLIGQITPGGVIPSGMPAALSPYLRGTPVQTVTHRVEQVAPRAVNVIHDDPHLARWLIPILGALGILGLFWYLLSGNQAPNVATNQVPITTVPAPPAPSVPAHLALANDNGVVTYSGTVHDDATRTSIVNALRGVFGANNVRGDINVDANAGGAPWLVNLQNSLGALNTPGTQAVFDGNTLKVGGLISDSDRNGIITSLRSALPAGLVVGALTSGVGNLVSEATDRTTAALSALRPGFTAPNLTGILNQSIINFPTNGADVPVASRALLQQAASAFKQLPAGTVVEIAGYTDNVGDPAANVQLSQQRAEAVRATLIQAGVDPNMLVARGYGSANPVGGNDTLEGRFRNRRIEYRVITQK